MNDLLSSLNFACNAAGLLYLADLQTMQLRSALTGSSSLLDAFMVCPGAYRQQDAPSLSKGEYPACAAMTTGYVFRVENEATVLQLQRLGKAGHLTTLSVSMTSNDSNVSWTKTIVDGINNQASVCYATTLALTLSAILALNRLEDCAALISLLVLIVTRLIDVVIFRRRARLGWKGAPEPGVRGDLLVLLSQDRWVRLQGMVDDIKTITSGQWLREITFLESSLVSFSTLLVFLNAAFVSKSTRDGQFVLIALMFGSAGMLGLANHYTQISHIYGRQIKPEGPARPYRRRLDLAEQLIAETGRDDWAIRLGMIQPKTNYTKQEHKLGPKIM